MTIKEIRSKFIERLTDIEKILEAESNASLNVDYTEAINVEIKELLDLRSQAMTIANADPFDWDASKFIFAASETIKYVKKIKDAGSADFTWEGVL